MPPARGKSRLLAVEDSKGAFGLAVSSISLDPRWIQHCSASMTNASARDRDGSLPAPTAVTPAQSAGLPSTAAAGSPLARTGWTSPHSCTSDADPYPVAPNGTRHQPAPVTAAPALRSGLPSALRSNGWAAEPRPIGSAMGAWGAMGIDRHAVVWVALVALAVLPSGCGNDTTSSSDDVGAGGPFVGCGSFAYPPSAFDGPTGAELGDDAAAQALRDLINDPEGIGALPPSDWRRLLDSDDEVVFGSGEPRNDGSEQGLVEVAVKRNGDRFEFYQSEYGCTPRAQVSGRSVAEFTIAGDAAIGPESTEVPVLVTEMQCTSGSPLGSRLGSPLVRYGKTTIEVLFTAEPLSGESFSCIGNPATSTTLHLDEPVGGRDIVDLSGYPPRDAADPGTLAAHGL